MTVLVINLGKSRNRPTSSAPSSTRHGLEMSIVAEGGDEGTAAFLAQEGCDAVQGYLLGKPAPIGQYAALVGRDNTMEPTRKTG